MKKQNVEIHRQLRKVVLVVPNSLLDEAQIEYSIVSMLAHAH